MDDSTGAVGAAGRSSMGATLALVAASVLGFGAPEGVQASAGGYNGKSVDPFVVRQRIRRDLPKINRCYESALRHEPDLEGKVSVRFAVIRTGDVKGVHVIENTTGSASVERCVARVVGALQFPRHRYGRSMRFTFPFVFARQR